MLQRVVSTGVFWAVDTPVSGVQDMYCRLWQQGTVQDCTYLTLGEVLSQYMDG